MKFFDKLKKYVKPTNSNALRLSLIALIGIVLATSIANTIYLLSEKNYIVSKTENISNNSGIKNIEEKETIISDVMDRVEKINNSGNDTIINNIKSYEVELNKIKQSVDNDKEISEILAENIENNVLESNIDFNSNDSINSAIKIINGKIHKLRSVDEYSIFNLPEYKEKLNKNLAYYESKKDEFYKKIDLNKKRVREEEQRFLAKKIREIKTTKKVFNQNNIDDYNFKNMKELTLCVGYIANYVHTKRTLISKIGLASYSNISKEIDLVENTLYIMLNDVKIKCGGKSNLDKITLMLSQHKKIKSPYLDYRVTYK